MGNVTDKNGKLRRFRGRRPDLLPGSGMRAPRSDQEDVVVRLNVRTGMISPTC